MANTDLGHRSIAEAQMIAMSGMANQTVPTPGKSPCQNCRERIGEFWWGDALAATHGFQHLWCEVCVLQAQIEHAKERSAALPHLEDKLSAIKAAEARKETGDE